MPLETKNTHTLRKIGYFQIIQPSFKLAFRFRRNIDFQGGGNGGHLGFPIETILAIFDEIGTI